MPLGATHRRLDRVVNGSDASKEWKIPKERQMVWPACGISIMRKQVRHSVCMVDGIHSIGYPMDIHWLTARVRDHSLGMIKVNLLKTFLFSLSSRALPEPKYFFAVSSRVFELRRSAINR